MKRFEKNYVVYVHEKLGGQKNIRLIRDKNIKKKGILRYPRKKGNIRKREKRKRIIYEDLLCAICKERAN